MKKFEFWLEFWLKKFVPMGPIDKSIGLDHGLAPNRRQAIIWTNADPIL